jgi:tRNA pseudouridine55 synthase
MFGFLVLDKPQGITSRAALNGIAKCLKPIRVGHAGTLDPLATGVLVACVGPATRLTTYVQQMPKTYVGSFRLGLRSDTEDSEGDVVALEDPPMIDEWEFRESLNAFVGRISQRPPAYSAIRVNGKRAFELARSGKKVDLQPRRVTVHSIELLSFAYPDFKIRVRCGSGTYMRSLGRDIGVSLGSCAIMTDLVRTRIGAFGLEAAMDPVSASCSDCETKLISPLAALQNHPRFPTDGGGVKAISHGTLVPLDASFDQEEAVAIDPARTLGSSSPAKKRQSICASNQFLFVLGQPTQ